ncbi:MAG TPA: hypothetical protein PLW01_11035, partial [Agitococcus sp.]|nr:hypothetical protein [Agitococcus sp.]
MNQNCNQKSCIKKVTWTVFIIVVAFIVGMVIPNYFNHEVEVEPLKELQEQRPAEKFLPLPEEQKELQGSPELSKLNPDPQI